VADLSRFGVPGQILHNCTLELLLILILLNTGISFSVSCTALLEKRYYIALNGNLPSGLFLGKYSHN
jgi:hypothetical protein